MEDFLTLEMPFFKPRYKKWKRYGCTNAVEKSNLKTVLELSTEGYCMYCFSRIRVDEKLYANLEHAIEKSNSDKLIECIPNIGLSCTLCNQTFKRIGERKRKLPVAMIDLYEKRSECSVENRKQCTVVCKALRNLQKGYSRLSGAEIILQPMGILGEDSHEELALQYNVLKMIFEPAKEGHTYTDKELRFIDAHINRFRLNDSQYRTRQLYDFVQNVIDSNGKMPTYEYNNLIVKLFREKLSGRREEEILKICKSVFLIMFPKM